MALNSRQLAHFALLLLAISATGCTSLKLPNFAFRGNATEYQGVQPGFESHAAISEQVYHSVRQARAENGVVLQVADDSMPCRVMPLPPGDKTVYVSDLLEQTGLLKKLDAVEATLFRHSSESIGGIKMEVTMSKNGRSVRPESDYALHPGDRLKVKKAPNPALQALVNAALGL